tara:strand:+ start:199 stop:579 length:381 start_codon:yes stop_codon:yes gene_type:complete
MVLLKHLKTKYLIFLLIIGCTIPEKNCELFKTGNYEFKSVIEGNEYVSNFKRSDSIEIEFFQGTTDTSSVRWVSDCEFILKNINPKKNKVSISMKILSTKANSYVFEYSIVGDNSNIKRGEAFKLD